MFQDSKRLLFFMVCLMTWFSGNTPNDLLAQEDQGWPREFVNEEARIIIYQPQIDFWESYRKLEGWVALDIRPTGSDKNILGSIKMRADTKTNFETRTVLIYNKEVVDTYFFTGDTVLSQRMREIALSYETKPRTISLDRLLAMVENLGEPARSIEDSREVPSIFYSSGPAVLVMFDGEPIFSPIKDSDLQFAVNTNWDVFLEKGTSNYYLLQEDVWLVAKDYKGPWQVVRKLPSSFSKLPDEQNWEEVKKHLAPKPIGSDDVPEILVATKPAELIVTEGLPQFDPIAGTNLMDVQNTDSDLFVHKTDSHYYFLVSGRWFKAVTLSGPWTYASDQLPADFAQIPSDHRRAHVLASVAGTREAELAVQQAQVPQQATVNREEATLDVTYEGEPDFQPIEETSMSYAVNSSYDVIYVDNSYYGCYQGVWFISSNSRGPWIVCSTVPSMIYTIPAHSPVHHVTYVHVYSHTPTTVVFGYTSGYMGIYISNGVVVYGTGYYYPPYYYYGAYYPVYYPYHHSYGVHAYYNPHTGTYARGAVAYGPYGGVGRSAAYNPRTGTYARGAAAWGPYNGTAAAHAYNPRTGTHAAGYRSYNSYSHWGETVVERGDKWVHSGHYGDDRGTVGGFRTSEGAKGVGWIGEESSGRVVKGADDDLYVGKDGSVYKRDGDNWYKGDDGSWDKVESSDEQKAQLEERRKSLKETRDGSGAESRMSVENKEQLRDKAQSADLQNKREDITPEQKSQARDRLAQADRSRAGQVDRSDIGANRNVEKLNRDFQGRREGNRRTEGYNSWRKNRSQGSPRSGRSRGFGGRRGRR